MHWLWKIKGEGNEAFTFKVSCLGCMSWVITGSSETTLWTQWLCSMTPALKRRSWAFKGKWRDFLRLEKIQRIDSRRLLFPPLLRPQSAVIPSLSSTLALALHWPLKESNLSFPNASSQGITPMSSFQLGWHLPSPLPTPFLSNPGLSIFHLEQGLDLGTIDTWGSIIPFCGR